jgi:protein-S-isoprenylcysteine O-methyltransferase Ste14
MSNKPSRVLRLISVIAYLAMVLGIIGMMAAHKLFSRQPVVILAQLGAVGLLVWARVAFGLRSFHVMANPTQGGLVTWGPYRVIRHPIYAAVSLFTVAGAAGNLSWVAAGFSGLVVASSLARIFCEEALLPGQYPEYREYSRRTWRMIPFVF